MALVLAANLNLPAFVALTISLETVRMAQILTKKEPITMLVFT